MFENSGMVKAFRAAEGRGMAAIVRVFKTRTKGNVKHVLECSLEAALGETLAELAMQCKRLIGDVKSQDQTATEGDFHNAFDLAKASTLKLVRAASIKAGRGSWVSSIFTALPGDVTAEQRKAAEDKGFIWDRDNSWVGESMGLPTGKAQEKKKDDSHLPIWEREKSKGSDAAKRQFLRDAGFSDHDEIDDEQIASIMRAASGAKSSEVDFDVLIENIKLKKRGEK